MNHRKCYVVDKKLDSYLAGRFGYDAVNRTGRFSPKIIAGLRGLYDTNAEEHGLPPLIEEGVRYDDMSDEQKDGIFNNLFNFTKGMAKSHAAYVNNSQKRIDKAYDKLRHAWSYKQRKSRIELVSNLFSWVVDSATEGTGIDRQRFVDGFASGGQKHGGKYAILEAVYDYLLKQRQDAYACTDKELGEKVFKRALESGDLDYEGAPKNVDEYIQLCEHQYNEYTKMLENWDALLPFVMRDLMVKEGVKLGIQKEFMAAASIDDYGENQLAEKWDMSEAKRDGWMENSDLQSSFGSVGKQVRRILATVPKMQAVLTEDENGNPKYEYQIERDDLGNCVFQDPLDTHQKLAEALRGMRDSDDMLARLSKKNKDGTPNGVAKVAWMQPILDLLSSSPQARTQFFCDFRKGFQPYSAMFEDKKKSYGKIRAIKTRLLNKTRSVLVGKYAALVMKGGKALRAVNPKGSVINEDGTVNWKRLVDLRGEVLAWCAEELQRGPGVLGKVATYGMDESPLVSRKPGASVTLNGEKRTVTYDMKKAFLHDVFTSLGIDADMDAIDSILQSNEIYKVRRALVDLFDQSGESGIRFVLSGKDKTNFGTLFRANKSKAEKQEALEELNKSHILFKRYVNFFASNDSQPVKEGINKLLNSVEQKGIGYRIERRCRYMGNTMYSDVAPSYLSDRLENLQSYVENEDKEGLLNYLKENYLNNPYFVDDDYLASDGEKGRILNEWLAHVVNACKDPKKPLRDSAASVFSFERDLGSTDKKFEDFTEAEHAVDMLVHFWADEQQRKGYDGKGKRNLNKKATALFPVFVLGDAGVSKYIRAPRHATPTMTYDQYGYDKEVVYKFDNDAREKVLDEFYSIYLQERRRMACDAAFPFQLYANGKPVNHPHGEFSILTFFNESSDEYSVRYSIKGHENDEGFIKERIKRYLDDASLNGIKQGNLTKPSFKKKLQDLGVLETTEYKNGPQYNKLSSIATPENIDEKIREFYWETKLATAQQLQVMTIDPAFYHGSKDLQKRYKEIHAPGSVLDLKAVNPTTGSPYSEDGIERVVYFEDINVDAERNSPEFMETIFRLYSNKSEEETGKAVESGILKPVDGDDAESKKKETERKNRIADFLGDNYHIYKAYTKNTLTDGQGYRTLDSYRKVMGMAGKWTTRMENMYNYIQRVKAHVANGQEMSGYERRSIESFMITLQPIKPYMFTHEKYPMMIDKKVNGQPVLGRDGNPVKMEVETSIPVQHKYAEAIIIPELLPKGSKLRKLGEYMERHDIDMAGSTKICKVGCFGQTDISKCAKDEEMEDALGKAYVHKLNYGDYRMQSNVPEHINSSQLFGTQVRKLIMSGLRKNGDYSSYIGGKKLNLSTTGDVNDANKSATLYGSNLMAFYNSLICSNIFDSYGTFAKNASDINSLSDMLMQSTAGSMREAMDNIFSYVVTGDEEGFKKFLIPLFEGGLEHDSAALILSTFRKIVNKQQICGGSAVQVSAFGIDGYKEDGGLRFVTDPDNNKNVLYAEVEMPFDRSYVFERKNRDGSVTKRQVALSYDKYCNLDGTLKPTGKPLKKGTAEWKQYQSYTYKKVDGKLVACEYDDPEAQVYKPLIEKDFPRILDIMAYRIPTERAYSMLSCKIKRFTSKVAGGTIKVPPQGATIAGFDFDIDKLYFMQREYLKHFNGSYYTEGHYNDIDKQTIWLRFFESNDSIKADLENARAEAEAKDPSLVEPIIVNGRDTGHVIHKTALNAYWDAAGIKRKYGLDKNEAFMKSAQDRGLAPTEGIKENEKVEWLEEYDFSKPPEENSRTARNNMLLDLMQARLSDPETARERYTPGGYDNAHKAARLMRELEHGDLTGVASESAGAYTSIDLDKIGERQDDDTDPEPNYDPTDPYTILYYNQQNQAAGKLIGIFANESTNHAFSSFLDEFRLNEPIEMFGHKYADLLHKGDSWKVDRNVAEFLAASVDAVKDPVLNFMNLNTITADVGAVMARLGFSMNEIALFLKHPAIQYACQDALNKNRNIKTSVEELRGRLSNSFTGGKPAKGNITSQGMALAIVNNRKMQEQGKTMLDYIDANPASSMDVLDMFNRLVKVSQDVNDFVLNTKFTASNSVKSTFGGMYAQQLKVQEYVDKFPKKAKDKGKLSYSMNVASDQEGTGGFYTPIESKEANLGMSRSEYLRHVRFNPFAFEQAMYDANRKAIRLLSKYYPYETRLYKDARAKMSGLARYGVLSEDDINDIHGDLPVALLARQMRSPFNGESAHVINGKATNVTNRAYYREKFAEDLTNDIENDPKLADLDIFQYLSPVSDTVQIGTVESGPNIGKLILKDIYYFNMQDVGGLDATAKEEIRESWASLMEVDDEGFYKNPKYAQIGRDLFMYCFYQMGFEFSPVSFMHLAPTAVKDSIIVEREDSLPINSFSSVNADTGKMRSDDVLVWSSNVIGGADKADSYGSSDLSTDNMMSGKTYKLPDELTEESVRKLCQAAKSNPQLRFKIDRDLTQAEFDLFTADGLDVPQNVCFSEGTLSGVSQESKEKMSYGKARTYREFLNEILDGKADGMNIDEFAQMFILNHLDNQRFVMNIGSANKSLKDFLDGKDAGGTCVRKDSAGNITIDLSSYRKANAFGGMDDLVKIEQDNGTGRISKTTWCPAIFYNGSYYLAQSGGDVFNEAGGTTISYVKVEPWGCSKKIYYGNGKEMSPRKAYKSSMDAQEIVNKDYVPEQPAPPVRPQPADNTERPNTQSAAQPQGKGSTTEYDRKYPNRNVLMRAISRDRERFDNEILDDFFKAYEKKGIKLSDEDKAWFKKEIKGSNNEEIYNLVETLRSACREDGVLMMDDKGNFMQGC